MARNFFYDAFKADTDADLVGEPAPRTQAEERDFHGHCLASCRAKVGTRDEDRELLAYHEAKFRAAGGIVDTRYGLSRYAA